MDLKQYVAISFEDGKRYPKPRNVIVCKDGFEMSVQGSYGHYCSPRENDSWYNSMEVGYPSSKEESIMEYAESKEDPTESVYGWVPCEVIQKIIDNHGGINIDKTFKI